MGHLNYYTNFQKKNDPNDDVIINWHKTAFFLAWTQKTIEIYIQWSMAKEDTHAKQLSMSFLENVWNDDLFFRQEGFYEDMPMEGQIGHRKIYLKQVK